MKYDVNALIYRETDALSIYGIHKKTEQSTGTFHFVPRFLPPKGKQKSVSCTCWCHQQFRAPLRNNTKPLVHICEWHLGPNQNHLGQKKWRLNISTQVLDCVVHLEENGGLMKSTENLLTSTSCSQAGGHQNPTAQSWECGWKEKGTWSQKHWKPG